MGTETADKGDARSGTGTLYIVSTPIGNLGDMSPRAVETLRNADLIAAEDTRNSLKLLNYFDIHTPMTSYHEHNRFDKARELTERLLKGDDIALISDAGTPVVSDPGEELIRLCIDQGIPVSAIPGPTAAVNALILSGMSAARWVFEGFLPPPAKKKLRKAALKRLAGETGTIILYEAPHRLRETMADLKEALGGTRRIALCREMTKLHEETLRGCIGDFLDIEPRGEYVLVIEGGSGPGADTPEEALKASALREQVAALTDEGYSEKEAMRQTASLIGVSRREIYNRIKRSEEDI